MKKARHYENSQMPWRFWFIDHSRGSLKTMRKEKSEQSGRYCDVLLGTLSTGSKGNMLLEKKWKQWEMEYYQPVMDTRTWNITNKL